MKVYYGLENLPAFKNPVLTIGTFDGVHSGHQAILKRLIQKAEEVQGETIVVTFDPHPRFVVSLHQKTISLLSTLSEKITDMEALGIHHLVVVPFTHDFANMDAFAYIQNFLVKYFHPHTLIIGFDHQFGKGRIGNFEMLELYKSRFNYQLEEIPMQVLEQNKISSTLIREALHRGDVKVAEKYLGRKYTISGLVVPGKRRGRQIGFPTANIHIESKEKLLPAIGVYAVQVLLKQRQFGGMMNIGMHPTFADTEQISPEVHIFDFDEDIYGQNMVIIFIDRIRDELKFDSVSKLIEALEADKKRTLEILKNV